MGSATDMDRSGREVACRRSRVDVGRGAYNLSVRHEILQLRGQQARDSTLRVQEAAAEPESFAAQLDVDRAVVLENRRTMQAYLGSFPSHEGLQPLRSLSDIEGTGTHFLPELVVRDSVLRPEVLGLVRDIRRVNDAIRNLNEFQVTALPLPISFEGQRADAAGPNDLTFRALTASLQAEHTSLLRTLKVVESQLPLRR